LKLQPILFQVPSLSLGYLDELPVVKIKNFNFFVFVFVFFFLKKKKSISSRTTCQKDLWPKFSFAEDKGKKRKEKD
jgi:hypothetical protein